MSHVKKKCKWYFFCNIVLDTNHSQSFITMK